MADWQRKIDISSLLECHHAGLITDKEFLLGVIAIVGKVRPLDEVHAPIEEHEARQRADRTIRNLQEEFQRAADDPLLDEDCCNALLSRLYDWGDRPIGGNGRLTKRCCWIKGA